MLGAFNCFRRYNQILWPSLSCVYCIKKEVLLASFSASTGITISLSRSVKPIYYEYCYVYVDVQIYSSSSTKLYNTTPANNFVKLIVKKVSILVEIYVSACVHYHKSIENKNQPHIESKKRIINFWQQKLHRSYSSVPEHIWVQMGLQHLYEWFSVQVARRTSRNQVDEPRNDHLRFMVNIQILSWAFSLILKFICVFFLSNFKIWLMKHHPRISNSCARVQNVQ